MANADPHAAENAVATPLPISHIVRTWWPLAASWLFMGAEGPMMTAVVTRLAEPKITLAAWSGIVFPVALVVEAPIIMLLSASTALSRDWDSYRKLRRFMMWTSAMLTALHVLVAFTPLYHVVAVKLIGAPAEIVEPARLGLMIMIPWTWSIAYRRFNQGVLIRFGHSRAVGFGTVIRLSTDALVLAAGYLLGTGRVATPISLGTIPGIAVASGAIASGVVSEAIYAGVRVQPVLRNQLRQALPADRPLTSRTFLSFYTPLALTALLGMVDRSIGSAALSRMPDPVDSLAVWGVVIQFLFLFRSLGFAFNEVVIALLDEPHVVRGLRHFVGWLIGLATGTLLIIAATPLATLWFERVSGLEPRLAALAQIGLWITFLIPALTVLQKLYEGTVVHSRRTRCITEAVVIFLAFDSTLLWAGVLWSQVTGLYIGLVAFVIATLAQTVWLWYRSRPTMRALHARDAGGAP